LKVIVGLAEETLASMKDVGAFGFAFIDAFIVNNVTYMKECKRLVKRGGVVIVDNIVQNGHVSDGAHTGAYSVSGRDLLKYLETDKELDATTVPTADSRGFDGWHFVLRK
ncbi:hypothetical protein HDZ31DRAFT_31162, partial [Schizophyllum fasciatum]